MADQTFTELETEYCPPLDPALLSAILSDFDLGDPQGLRAARSTLDPLKESALFEEQIGFDASGTGGAHHSTLENEKLDRSLPDTSAGSVSRDTDLTSFSNGIACLDLQQSPGEHDRSVDGIDHTEDLEKLDDVTKVQLLSDVLGKRVSQYSIKHTLQKCNGRWHTAMEELLNHVYFEDAELSDLEGKVPAKGVDAFAENQVVKRGRRGKAKNKRLQGNYESQSSSVSNIDPVPPQNKWNVASQDIEFMVQRTGLSPALVSSTYYQHGATLSKAIGALLNLPASSGSGVNMDAEMIATNARELGLEFPTIPRNDLTALIRLTYPSTASAHELAKAMTASDRPAQSGGLQIITNYQPPIGVETEPLTRPGSKSSRLTSIAPESIFSNDIDPAARAQAYATARNMAFAQAQAAHRRAKSDRFMGGAAAYYGQVSRDLAALSVRASAAAADDLVATQSSASQVDLHGVDVANAVRIAQARVTRWWADLGENRVNGRVGAEDRRAGFRIVVGLGRHSEGGKSKIGPAVKKILREEGWRFEDAGAVILVTGRVKK